MSAPDLKAKIRASMIEHLKSKGYPNMTSRQILAELKPMWIKLEEANLVQPGWKYQQYVGIAQAQAHLQNVKDALHEELMRHFTARPKR